MQTDMQMFAEMKKLERQIMSGKVQRALRLGPNPKICPRCNGNVIVETGAHVCLQCGWRQDHIGESFKERVASRYKWEDLTD
jgi:hypothetical protein